MESGLLELKEALNGALQEKEKYKKLLEQSESARNLLYLNAVIVHSPCASVLENEHHEIVLANQRFCDLFSIPLSISGVIGTSSSKWIEAAKHAFKDGEGLPKRTQDIWQRQVANSSYEQKANALYLREYIPVLDSTQNCIGHLWNYHEVASKGLEKALAENAGHSRLSSKSGFPSLSGAHVLLVEDNEVNRFLTTELLKSWGITVEVANNGQEGLEKWKSKDYHLLLMDIQMPVMDGLEAAYTIRKDVGPKSKVPLIALTANVSKGQKEEVLAVGFNEYISKPVNEAELYSKMASFLSSVVKKRAKKESSLYDYSILSRLSFGNKEFEKKMLRIFIDTVPISITKLQEAWAAKNFSQLTITAHKLKTTVHTMGIQPLKEPIKKLEAQAGTGTASEETQEQVETICNFLKAIVSEFESVVMD